MFELVSYFATEVKTINQRCSFKEHLLSLILCCFPH